MTFSDIPQIAFGPSTMVRSDSVVLRWPGAEAALGLGQRLLLRARGGGTGGREGDEVEIDSLEDVCFRSLLDVNCLFDRFLNLSRLFSSSLCTDPAARYGSFVSISMMFEDSTLI